MKIFADTSKGYPQVCEYKNGYGLVIKAICRDCRREHLIFDGNKHGWNGFVCRDGISVLDGELRLWRCPKCRDNIFNMKIHIMSQGKQDFIDESGVADGESDLFEDDWVEAFAWIVIGLICNKCRHSDQQCIDYETM